MEKKNKYIITYINTVGELMTIERVETEEELKERLECYKRNGIKVKKILMENIVVTYTKVEF